jgi:hypothetical protein
MRCTRTRPAISWGFPMTVCLLVMCAAILHGGSLAAQADTICFPPHEGLPHTYKAPTPDGFAEPEVGLPTTAATRIVETGWTRSGRETYVSDGVVPMAQIQTLTDNALPQLYLSFSVNWDQSFDNDDAIVLVFHPTPYSNPAPSQHDASARRIDIRPLYLNVGAGTAASTDPKDDAVNKVRTNREPFEMTIYRWNTGATPGWQAITSNLTSSAFVARVRSWDNGVGGAGIPPDRNWFVEVQVPTTTAAGGTSWINLGDRFGFYANVIRVCGSTSDCSNSADPANDSLVTSERYTSQFVWPRATYAAPYDGLIVDGATPLVQLTDAPIPPSWLGPAIRGSAAGCRGVRFVGGSSGIGIQDPANPSGPLGTDIDGATTAVNTFTARVQNDGPNPATNVSALFRIAKWGINSPTLGEWLQIPTVAPATSAPQTIPAGGGSVDLTVPWSLTTAEQPDYAPPHQHQCVVAVLSSTSNARFSESSVRRNMDFFNLSTLTKEAEISGKGQPAGPVHGSNYEFRLVPSQRVLNTDNAYDGWQGAATGGSDRIATHQPSDSYPPIPQLSSDIFQRWQGMKKPAYSVLSVVNGYRRTPAILSMGGRKYRLYDPTGAFAYVGEHSGAGTEFSAGFSGSGITKFPGGSMIVTVPVDSSTAITTTLSATDRGTILSVIPWWAWLLLVLFVIVLWLLFRKKP